MNEGNADSQQTWANRELSARLLALAAAGESQNLEFKERFPDQARDLGKEIAAFATSNAGTILLGVADNGTIVGLAECLTHEGRSQVIQRIEGICTSSVKPIVTPTIHFGVLGHLVVVSIEVPKGNAPLYYAGNIPYIRQITAARPAEPQEVIDLVLAWERARNPDAGEDPVATFLSRAATIAIDVLVYASELDERQVSPWIEQLQGNLALEAQLIRDLAIDAPTECSDMVPTLETLESNLDKAAHERLSLGGGWKEMQEAAVAAIEKAQEIRGQLIGSVSAASVDGLRNTVELTARKLDSLCSRLEMMEEQNRLDEVKSAASEHGLILLKAAAFGLGLGDATSLAELTSIGRLLRGIETRREFADGGQWIIRMFEDMRQASASLTTWLRRLDAR